MRPTYHLVPAADWGAMMDTDPYVAASLADEGFVHCTDGAMELLHTADRHFLTDPRPFVVLTIDLDRVGARWTMDDPAGIYPHVHGPIERAAILEVAPVEREPDGRFRAIGHGSPLG